MFNSLAFLVSISVASTVTPERLGFSIENARSRLRNVADRAFADARNLQIQAAGVSFDRPATIRAAARAVAAADADLSRGLENQRRLVEESIERIGWIPTEFQRARDLTEHYGRMHRPPPTFSSTAEALGAENLLTMRYRQNRGVWKLPRLVHQLREHPAVLRDPVVQRVLHDVVVDRMASVVRRSVWLNAHPFGWSLEDSVAPFPAGEEPWTLDGARLEQRRFNRDLVNVLVRELRNNAYLASRRRHCEFTLAHAPRFAIHGLDDGGLALEFEDFGDPDDYFAVTGLGQSHDPRFGVGIGRFHTFVIADFLGYEITRAVKTDGSGSIIRVIVPKVPGATLLRRAD